MITINKLPKKFVEHNILPNQNNDEAYMYKITNLKNNKKYLGIHKGEFGDGYWHSSTNKEFQKALSETNAKFRIDVFKYGTYEQMSAEEHRFLKEVNAQTSNEWYNKWNGLSNDNSLIIRTDLVHEIAKEILNERSYKNISPIVKDIAEIYKKRKLQIRTVTFDPTHKKELQVNIDDNAGDTSNLLVVLLENRLYNDVKSDLVIDGNHSIQATNDSKHGNNIPVLNIPEQLHKNLTDDEVGYLGLCLNPRKKEIRKESSLDDIADIIFKMMLKGSNPRSSEIKSVKLNFNLSSADSKKVQKIANQKYADSTSYLNKNWIDYSVGQDKKDLVARVEQENKGKEVYCKSFSTKNFNPWADLYNIARFKEQNINVKLYKVLFWHPSKKVKELWEKQFQVNNQSTLELYFKPHNIEVVFEYMPTTRSKVSS